ncbi:hypothetical protein L211DRAFT_698266 [Terfezia boudieri ATCC MYA-4762]|uniref:Crinkler effector protein N-terminal domain-containing protein n=1 Tax=Terfezia boudieri ATCC MYA-4762 TaxID=1051890 RepID=A0A3N4LT98_9PEZI|nr:hypothetical protein L211DRAFT_698266 [Terfezia boudieri ATCC MYA-4762]
MPWLFCLVWGDSDAETFPVMVDGGDTVGVLKKLIIIEGPLSLRDMRAPNLKLWKWNKPDMVTDSDLDSNTVLNPMVKIEGIFKNDPPQEACVHIIIRTPERDTLSFPEPDWSNLGSIYTWFQRFTLQRGRNPLVGTFGRDFKFLGREKTIEALWDGNGLRPGIAKRFEKHNEHDKNLHPIPILAGGPGTGKSRFLDEIEGLIFCCASKSPDMNIQKGFENMAVINVNYGNGSAASDMDIRIGAQASLSLRLLFETLSILLCIPLYLSLPRTLRYISKKVPMLQ